jgi:hypothetical protein
MKVRGIAALAAVLAGVAAGPASAAEPIHFVPVPAHAKEQAKHQIEQQRQHRDAVCAHRSHHQKRCAKKAEIQAKRRLDRASAPYRWVGVGWARFNPCGITTYAVDWSGAEHRAKAQRDLDYALPLVEAASGLRFQQVTYRPDESNGGAQVLFHGSPEPVAAAAYTLVTGDDGSAIGQIALDHEWDRDGSTGKHIMVHELGHLAGLDHVTDQREAMDPIGGAKAYGPGDLAGLWSLNAGAGCL